VIIAIVGAFIVGTISANPIVEAAGGWQPITEFLQGEIDKNKGDIASLDSRTAELEAIPHMVKTVKFNRLDGPVAEEGQTPNYLNYTTTGNATSDGKFMFQFVGTDVICSEIRVHYSVDDVPKGVTEWLGYTDGIPNLPLSTEIISIDSLTPGEHTLTLRPEGRVSGCNTAGIAAWGGTIILYQ
jgi:hypothetical protein